MKKYILGFVLLLIMSGCTAKYSSIQADGTKLVMENYVISETIKYSPDGKIISSKKTMLPFYEGMIGKFSTLMKPMLELLAGG